MRVFFIPEHELTVPELKILIDALHAARFVPMQKTEDLITKVADLGGSHKAELLKENMVYFNTRKHTNEAILLSVDSIEDFINIVRRGIPSISCPCRRESPHSFYIRCRKWMMENLLYGSMNRV